MITQSVGVPLTAKCLSATSRSRSGSLSDSECDTPDWSLSGATIQTSSDKVRAIFSQASRPGAWMPSSLVIRIRIISLYGSRSAAQHEVVRCRAGTPVSPKDKLVRH